MLPRRRERLLHVQSPLKNRITERHAGVRHGAASPDLPVIFVVARAEQHLQVDDGTRRCLTSRLTSLKERYYAHAHERAAIHS